MAALTKEDYSSRLDGDERYLLFFVGEDGNVWFAKDISSLDDYPFTTEFVEASRFDKVDATICRTLATFAYPERTFELMKITLAVSYC